MPGQNSAPVDHEPNFQPFFINAKPAEVVQLWRAFVSELRQMILHLGDQTSLLPNIKKVIQMYYLIFKASESFRFFVSLNIS